MVFSSVFFLFFYLPIVLIVHYLTPVKWRNAVLLVFNLIFYGWGEPVYIVIMFASIAIDYTHGMLVEKCKAKGNDKGARMAVASSVFLNLLLLFFFKYWDFIAGTLQNLGIGFMPVLGLSLPIGISFYTFQTMSYTIDVYRGDAKAQHSIINFGTFVTLFPQLIAGPIIKYKDLGDQIDHREYHVEQFASGVQVFVVGLAKKVLLANNLGMLWDAYKAMPTDQLTTAGAWLGMVAFAFQIYFDFSGYSDMAIGLGRLFGFRLPENFNYPYISGSVTEFWRRWHMTLSGWFRDYLYIPLGGSRRSLPRNILNLLIVWTLTGFWHGADWNFLIWGLWYAAFLIGERYVWRGAFTRLPAALRHVLTLLVVMLGWVWFRASGPKEALDYFAALFSGPLWSGEATYWLSELWPELLLGAILAAPVYPALKKRLGLWNYFLALAVFGLAVSSLLAAGFNPFIYFRF